MIVIIELRFRSIASCTGQQLKHMQLQNKTNNNACKKGTKDVFIKCKMTTSKKLQLFCLCQLKHHCCNHVLTCIGCESTLFTEFGVGVNAKSLPVIAVSSASHCQQQMAIVGCSNQQFRFCHWICCSASFFSSSTCFAMVSWNSIAAIMFWHALAMSRHFLWGLESGLMSNHCLSQLHSRCLIASTKCQLWVCSNLGSSATKWSFLLTMNLMRVLHNWTVFEDTNATVWLLLPSMLRGPFNDVHQMSSTGPLVQRKHHMSELKVWIWWQQVSNTVNAFAILLQFLIQIFVPCLSEHEASFSILSVFSISKSQAVHCEVLLLLFVQSSCCAQWQCQPKMSINSQPDHWFVTSARRATGNHPDATGMPMMKGRLGASCPFRTAIALSERPKPRRTPTKAP